MKPNDIFELLNKFMKSGNVNNRQHDRSGLVNNEDTSRPNVFKIFHQHKFHLYQMKSMG